MKILSAILDTVLIPVAVAKDIVIGPIRTGVYDEKSFTREQIEKVEEHLRLR